MSDTNEGMQDEINNIQAEIEEFRLENVRTKDARLKLIEEMEVCTNWIRQSFVCCIVLNMSLVDCRYIRPIRAVSINSKHSIIRPTF